MKTKLLILLGALSFLFLGQEIAVAQGGQGQESSLVYVDQMMPATRNDIAWENDIAAYRMYSRVLLSSEPNSANGVDLWVKKQTAPIIPTMYTYADYHNETPVNGVAKVGVDAYSVGGKTLGAGGVVAYVSSKLWLHDPYDECQIIENGPTRGEFILTYKKVEVAGDFYTKTLRITTEAGGLLNKAVVKYEGRIKPMQIAAGILLHTGTNAMQYKTEKGLIGYAEEKSEGTVVSPNARFYEGVYMPGETTVSVIDNQLVVRADYAVGTEYTYYFGGAWSVFPAGRFPTDQSWFDALKAFKDSVVSVPALTTTLPTKAEVINTAVGVNAYWIGNHTDPGTRLWNNSVYHAGNIDFYKVHPKSAYLNYANQWATKHSWGIEGGTTTDFADNHTAGQTYLALYKLDATKVASKISAIKTTIDNRITGNPKSDEWWWVDAMLMAMPVITQLGEVTGDTKYYDKLYALYSNTRNKTLVSPTRTWIWPVVYQNKYGKGPLLEGIDTVNGYDYTTVGGLYNETDHLWWRDWGYKPGVPPKIEPLNSSLNVPKVSPNGKNVYWARGNGWAIAAIARTLKYLPADEAHRAEYETLFKDMSAALKDRQQADGFWYMNLDDPEDNPGPETSGTALITYGLAWGINSGLLDSGTYLPVVAKGWNALANVSIQKNGNVRYIQNEGEKPVSITTLPTTSVDFGVGAVLWAASEVVKLASGEMPEVPVLTLDVTTVSLQTTTPSRVRVTFDKKVEPVSATTIANYTITGVFNDVSIDSIQLTSPTIVTLFLNKKVEPGRYLLSITDVVGIDGEKIDGSIGKTFNQLVTPDTPEAGITVTAIGYQSGTTNTPDKTLDKNINTRWAQAGFGQWIKYDLGKEVEVYAVDIAVYNGNSRVQYFDIDVSSDNTSFFPVLTGGESSGSTSESMERYYITPTPARYVRIICNSNSAGGENWNSLTEVRIRYNTLNDMAEIDANDPVINVKYYNLTGQPVGADLRISPTTGVYIIKKTHASGKTTVTKELKAKEKTNTTMFSIR